jgi:hypothetical protein
MSAVRLGMAWHDAEKTPLSFLFTDFCGSTILAQRKYATLRITESVVVLDYI